MPAATTGTPVTRLLSRAATTRSPYEATQSTDATVSCVLHGMPDTGNAITWSVIAARKSHAARRRISASWPRLPPSARPSPTASTTGSARITSGDATWKDENLGELLLRGDQPEPFEVSLERCDDRGVELDARVLAELLERLFGARSVAVAAIGGDRVVRVGDEDQPRAEGNLLPGEAEGI